MKGLRRSRPAEVAPVVADTLRRYLAAEAFGRAQGKTRVQVLHGLAVMGMPINPRDLRLAMNLLVSWGYPAITSNTFGHYYARDEEDLRAGIAMRRSMAATLNAECDAIVRAWDKEIERRGQARQGRLL